VSADTAFSLLNAAVLPWWLLWLAAPRSALARRAASHGAVFVALSLVYAVFFGAALASNDLSGGMQFEAVRAALATSRGFLAGWTHYLCFDLFAGAWILRESRRLDVEPRPFLFLTLMAGPLGLGSFLVRRAWRLRRFGGIGDTDLA
jgi:hypothetical protein